MVGAGDRKGLTVSASAKTGQGLDDFITCLEVIRTKRGCQTCAL